MALPSDHPVTGREVTWLAARSFGIATSIAVLPIFVLLLGDPRAERLGLGFLLLGAPLNTLTGAILGRSTYYHAIKGKDLWVPGPGALVTWCAACLAVLFTMPPMFLVIVALHWVYERHVQTLQGSEATWAFPLVLFGVTSVCLQVFRFVGFSSREGPILFLFPWAFGLVLGLSLFDTLLVNHGIPKQLEKDQPPPSVQFYLSDLLAITALVGCMIQGFILLAQI